MPSPSTRKGSFSDDLPAIRGRPALIRPHQSEIAISEFKPPESHKI
jgi:hypothetical protein